MYPGVCLTSLPPVQAASQAGSVTAQQARRMDGAFLAVGALNDILKRKVGLIGAQRTSVVTHPSQTPACPCLPAAMLSLYVSGQKTPSGANVPPLS